MVSSDRQQYSPQCKLHVVLELLRSEEGAAQTARERKSGRDPLLRWKDIFHIGACIDGADAEDPLLQPGRQNAATG